MNKTIYLSSPDVTQAEEDALVRAIRSGWIAPLGPEVDAFEEELAAYSGRKHAVVLSRASAVLECRSALYVMLNKLRRAAKERTSMNVLSHFCRAYIVRQPLRDVDSDRRVL